MPIKQSNQNPYKPVKFKPLRKVDFENFCQFYMLPGVMRMKEFGFFSEDDWCKSKHVNPDTKNEWKKSDLFKKSIAKIAYKWGIHQTPEIIYSLYKTCVHQGTAPEVKLWMQIIEGWSEKTTAKEPDNKILKQLSADVKTLLEQEKRKNTTS